MSVHDNSLVVLDLQFSYSQFFVYDAGLKNPACEWTEAHSRQGFARRDGVTAVGTILEFGQAKVTLTLGPMPVSQINVTQPEVISSCCR